MFENAIGLTLGGKVLTKLATGSAVLWELITSAYTNQVPISIDTDGSIYNGVGYKRGYRLSSSGAEKALTGCMLTGYMPAKSADTVYIGGEDVAWINSNHQAANYICCYDSDFNFICAQNCMNGYTGGTVSGDSTLAKVILPTNEEIAFIRVSDNGASASTAGNLIVTINEEITG